MSKKLLSVKLSKNSITSFFLITAFFSIPSIAAPPPNPPIDDATLTAIERDLGLSREQAVKRISQENEKSEIARELIGQLGDSYAGAWLDSTRGDNVDLIVAVTDEKASISVSAAGAIPTLVRHPLSTLNRELEKLDMAILELGDLDALASWYVDVKSNTLVIEGVKGKPDFHVQLERLLAVSDADLDLLRVERVNSRPKPLFHGGTQFNHNGQPHCSRGFNVTVNPDANGVGTRGFTTAGHCVFTLPQDVYSPNEVLVGSLVARRYPIGDSALGLHNRFLRLWLLEGNRLYHISTHGQQPTHVSVTGETPAEIIGTTICRSGFTTGYRCGSITGFNVTANYGQGPVIGLTRINACAGQGDSGGSAIDANGHAQGMTSGGILPPNSNTNCHVSNPVTYIEPWEYTKQELLIQGFTIDLTVEN